MWPLQASGTGCLHRGELGPEPKLEAAAALSRDRPSQLSSGHPLADPAPGPQLLLDAAHRTGGGGCSSLPPPEEGAWPLPHPHPTVTAQSPSVQARHWVSGSWKPQASTAEMRKFSEQRGWLLKVSQWPVRPRFRSPSM